MNDDTPKDKTPIDDAFFDELDLSEDIKIFLESTNDTLRKTRLQNGAVYVGGWLNKARHGFGLCVFPDKSYYFGEWD